MAPSRPKSVRPGLDLSREDLVLRDHGKMLVSPEPSVLVQLAGQLDLLRVGG